MKLNMALLTMLGVALKVKVNVLPVKLAPLTDAIWRPSGKPFVMVVVALGSANPPILVRPTVTYLYVDDAVAAVVKTASGTSIVSELPVVTVGADSVVIAGVVPQP